MITLPIPKISAVATARQLAVPFHSDVQTATQRNSYRCFDDFTSMENGMCSFDSSGFDEGNTFTPMTRNQRLQKYRQKLRETPSMRVLEDLDKALIKKKSPAKRVKPFSFYQKSHPKITTQYVVTPKHWGQMETQTFSSTTSATIHPHTATGSAKYRFTQNEEGRRTDVSSPAKRQKPGEYTKKHIEQRVLVLSKPMKRPRRIIMRSPPVEEQEPALEVSKEEIVEEIQPMKTVEAIKTRKCFSQSLTPCNEPQIQLPALMLLTKRPIYNNRNRKKANNVTTTTRKRVMIFS